MHIPRRHSTQVRDTAETRGHSTMGTEKCHGNITTAHLKKKKIRTSALSNSSMAICWKRKKRRERKKETLGKETQLSWASDRCLCVTTDSARQKLGRRWPSYDVWAFRMPPHLSDARSETCCSGTHGRRLPHCSHGRHPPRRSLDQEPRPLNTAGSQAHSPGENRDPSEEDGKGQRKG